MVASEPGVVTVVSARKQRPDARQRDVRLAASSGPLGAITDPGHPPNQVKLGRTGLRAHFSLSEAKGSQRASRFRQGATLPGLGWLWVVGGWEARRHWRAWEGVTQQLASCPTP